MSNNKDFKVKNGIQPASYQESLGTVVSGSVTVNDLSTASYDNVSFSVASQDALPFDIFFKPDGTKLYMLGYTNDTIYQYSLSTAYDISTASYDSVSFSVLSQDANPSDITFKPDGTKMYLLGNVNDNVHQYSLSTAWDLSTASYDSVSFNVATEDIHIYGIDFKPDGTKMYIVGLNNDNIYQYSLSTAWDVSTASYDSVSFSVLSQDSLPYSIILNDDGTKIYMLGYSTDTVYQYTMSTAYDLSTASYANKSFSLTLQDNAPSGIEFNSNGTKMYMVGRTTDTIYQYTIGSNVDTNTLDLSTGNAFQITPTSDIQIGLSNPAASGTVSQATLLLDGVISVGYDLRTASYDSVSFSVTTQEFLPTDIAFNNDGTKMYMVGIDSDNVHQYTLSTGFDLSTASYDSVSFSVNTQDATPYGIAFNNNGTKMYMIGTTNDSVHQYTLSTGFDLSTASYDSVSFSVTTQDDSPRDVAFNNDGTKMYIVGTINDSVHQYTLSTGFDISTASYDSVSFSVAGQDGTPIGIVFNNDGTKMYITGFSNDRIYQYTLSTAFDVSTASYDIVSLNVATQDSSSYGIAFNNNGTKMYMVGNLNDSVYQYSMGSAYTVTYDSAIQFGGDTAPDSPSIGETDVITFSTRDGGTTYQAVQAIDGAV